MSTWTAGQRTGRRLAAFAVLAAAAPGLARAQDRLKTMPGYERYQKAAKEMTGAFKSGALRVDWKDGGKALEFRKDGKRYRYDIADRRLSEPSDNGEKTPAPAPPPGRGGRRRPIGPQRGRQFDSALSPSGKLKAFHRDRNLWLGDPDGAIEVPVTNDGSTAGRVKYATASWVYGEELYQTTAMWWSPDSTKIAFYRFDESGVKDYYLQLHQTDVQDTLDVEAYPKAGAPNPVVDLMVYDVKAKKTVKVDVRDGKQFADDVVGHYVYHVQWSPDGKELLFNRTNRRQNVLELAACDPETGKCRVVVREEWPASWVENTPTQLFLNDGKRFLWASERNGWRNYYLYDLGGRLLATVTDHNDCEAGEIVRVDEEAGQLYYMAHSGDNPLKQQLHRVGLDGKGGGRRLTDPAYHHSVDLAPDAKHLVDVVQTHDTPPATRLMTVDGEKVADLAESDLSKFESLGLRRVERFTFKAADGETDLYGLLHRPSDFDPSKKYPLLVSVYAGPATNGARETFVMPEPLTEYGFLVASLDSRSAAGRGKRFLDAIYLKLGRTEIDDQAAGVKALRERPYVDGGRVGIFGTSYGGTASAMALLRHPDVFQAACAGSAVTDWRNYDTIYTERYMRTPQENSEGYEAGRVMTYAKNLKGRLMIYYGTADDNVHPSNSLQLIRALQQAGKSFEVQVGPDQGHSALGRDRMMEFFIESLVLEPQEPQGGRVGLHEGR
jgi:dipeptidyl-peptidase-4